jgi:hypothetical protein
MRHPPSASALASAYRRPLPRAPSPAAGIAACPFIDRRITGKLIFVGFLNLTRNSNCLSELYLGFLGLNFEFKH